jgi:hypothetical protein
MSRSRFVRVAALLLAASALSGCFAQNEALRRKLAEQLKPVRSVGIASPDVKIYELDAGGMRILRDAWSQQGEENVSAALRSVLREKGFSVKVVEPTAQTREELDEVRLLYQAVGQAILDARSIYYYGHGWWDLDYTVGPVDKLLARYGVDALALTYASDEISTGGRKATAAIAGLFGVQVRGGISWASVAIVDRSGKVLWFHDAWGEAAYDLRDAESARALVGVIVNPIPVGDAK